MKNSNLKNEYLDDEIDLIEILRTIYNSKKLIILITLASALLAFTYAEQKKEVKYQSSVIIEVGSYDLPNGEKKLIEPVSSLIKNLKIHQISLKLNNSIYTPHTQSYFNIEDQLLEIKYTSPSLEFNEKILKEIIKYTQENHKKLLVIIKSPLSTVINVIEAHELELRSNIKSNYASEGLFRLRREKDQLNLRLKLMNNQENITQQINGLKTIEIKTNPRSTILVGAILGFLFSVFIVLIRQAFLKKKN